MGWTVYANLTLPVPTGKGTKVGALEDPFMWVDRRGNWHILNHAYDIRQTDHCANSTLSAHSFSPDGRTWHMLSPKVEPYGHTVLYEDGSSHMYITLERPNIHFNSQKQMTHLS